MGRVKKWSFLTPKKVPFRAIGYTSLDPSNSDSKTGKNERVRSYQVNFPTCFCLPWRWAVTVARDNRTMCRKSKQKYIKENLRKRNNVIDLCPWLNTHLNIFVFCTCCYFCRKVKRNFEYVFLEGWKFHWNIWLKSANERLQSSISNVKVIWEQI